MGYEPALVVHVGPASRGRASFKSFCVLTPGELSKNCSARPLSRNLPFSSATSLPQVYPPEEHLDGAQKKALVFMPGQKDN